MLVVRHPDGYMYLALQFVHVVGGKRHQYLGRVVPQQAHGLHESHVVRQLILALLDRYRLASVSCVCITVEVFVLLQESTRQLHRQSRWARDG